MAITTKTAIRAIDGRSMRRAASAGVLGPPSGRGAVATGDGVAGPFVGCFRLALRSGRFIGVPVLAGPAVLAASANDGA